MKMKMGSIINAESHPKQVTRQEKVDGVDCSMYDRKPSGVCRKPGDEDGFQFSVSKEIQFDTDEQP